MNDLLKNIDRNHLDKICKKYSIRELSVFGSFAKGNYTKDSDLDILVDFESLDKITLITLSKIRYTLSAIFEKEVDLVMKDGLKKLIKEEVINSSKVIYATR